MIWEKHKQIKFIEKRWAKTIHYCAMRIKLDISQKIPYKCTKANVLILSRLTTSYIAQNVSLQNIKKE